jgi:hypothetical protein
VKACIDNLALNKAPSMLSNHGQTEKTTQWREGLGLDQMFLDHEIISPGHNLNLNPFQAYV